MEETIFTKPVLKWAGGKSQLLGEILPRMPKNYNKYIIQTNKKSNKSHIFISIL